MAKASAKQLTSIVVSALNKSQHHGIVDVLREIGEAVDACGCILWVTDPWTDLTRKKVIGRLYVFARWLCDDIKLPLRELPIERSANGNAIITKTTQNIDNLKTVSFSFKDDEWIVNADLTSACIVPIKFNSEHFNATLSVYRNRKVKRFSSEEQSFVELIAEILPGVNRAIRDKVRYQLLTKTTQILYNLEQAARQKQNDSTILRLGLESVCTEVANSFQCIETSVFLKKTSDDDYFNLIASSYQDWKDEKVSYRASKKEGLTGWVLDEKQSVNIFNLAYFDKDISQIRKEYPDIQWNDSLNIEPIARKTLRVSEGVPLPISYMAVPIYANDSLLGVIRCCAAKRDPWFFSDGQVEILRSVATQIHRFWTDWLLYLNSIEENRVWANFVESIQTLNTKVQEDFSRSDIQEDTLFNEIVGLCKTFVGKAEIMKITDEMVKTVFSQGTQPRGRKRHRVAGSRTDTVNRAFSIGSQNTFLGLLLVQFPRNKRISQDAERMLELLAQQLNLYISIVRSEKEQRQFFEDFNHSIKSPIRLMYVGVDKLLQRLQYLNDLIKSSNSDWRFTEAADKISREAFFLRNLARKAKRITVNTGVFKELSKEKKITLSKMQTLALNAKLVSTLLSNASMDIESSLDRNLQIRYHVYRETFSELNSLSVIVDIDLLEQAVNCLLDNAGKYSYENSSVRIFGGKTIKNDRSYFYISISNDGPKIKASEVPHLADRYFRGVGAKNFTGEGSGIGLWIVDGIMEAHDGELEIIPENETNRTEFRLLFPIRN